MKTFAFTYMKWGNIYKGIAIADTEAEAILAICLEQQVSESMILGIKEQQTFIIENSEDKTS